MADERLDNPFARVDETPPEVRRVLVDYLDAVAVHREIERVRTAAFETFAPAEGERLLDAGCGLGEVARQLGARVGAKGAVAAVDRSAETIAIARSRDDGSPVTYSVGDVTALDFPDGHFDGVRAERVVQHLPDPDAAIKELARVTRPGGRVCVIDTDWSSLAWDGFEHLEDARSAFVRRIGAQDLMAARTIRSRMVEAGLTRTSMLPVTLRFMSPDDAAVVAVFFNRKIIRDLLAKDLFDRFFDSVDRATDRGVFLFAFTMWIGLGHVACE